MCFFDFSNVAFSSDVAPGTYRSLLHQGAINRSYFLHKFGTGPYVSGKCLDAFKDMKSEGLKIFLRVLITRWAVFPQSSFNEIQLTQ